MNKKTSDQSIYDLSYRFKHTKKEPKRLRNDPYDLSSVIRNKRPRNDPY